MNKQIINSKDNEKFDLKKIQEGIFQIQKDLVLKDYQRAYVKCTFLWRSIDSKIKKEKK
jgi:hypothetical protein